jgi:hypothetical protein
MDPAVELQPARVGFLVASEEGAILGLGWVEWVRVRKVTSIATTRKVRYNKHELVNVMGVRKGRGGKGQG